MISTHVINLHRRPDRLERVKARFAAVGIEVCQFQAIDSQSLETTSTEGRSHQSTLSPMDACWLSHSMLADQISEGNDEYVLVLEDDALPLTGLNWPTLLERIPEAMSSANLGYLQLGFISYFYRWSRTGVRDALNCALHRDKQRVLRLDERRIAVVGSSRAGAHAYVVSRDFVRQTRRTRWSYMGSPDGYFDQMARAHGQDTGDEFLSMARLRSSIVEQESRTRRSAVLDSDIE